MSFNFTEFDQQLKLVSVFKEKRPSGFYEAYQLAIDMGIRNSRIIVNALEVYAVEKMNKKV